MNDCSIYVSVRTNLTPRFDEEAHSDQKWISPLTPPDNSMSVIPSHGINPSLLDIIINEMLTSSKPSLAGCSL